MTNRQGMNLILDSLGGNHWQKNYRLLRPAGRLIHIGISSLALEHRYSTMEFLRARLLTPRYTPAGLMQDNKAIIGFDIRQLWDETELLDAAMAQIIAWYDEALFRPRIDTRFPFLRAADAHLRLQQRKNVGKVLLLL